MRIPYNGLANSPNSAISLTPPAERSPWEAHLVHVGQDPLPAPRELGAGEVGLAPVGKELRPQAEHHAGGLAGAGPSEKQHGRAVVQPDVLHL